MRLRRTTLWVLTSVLLAASLAVAWQRIEADRCGSDVELVETPANPLMSPALMAERPDERRDRLVAAVAKLPAPFGRPLAGVDYYYDQWLHLYGVDGGVLAWTKRNAPVTMLSADDMEPVWALRPAAKRVAWDASAEDFLLLSLSAEKPTRVLAADLATGETRWCAELTTRNAEGEPITTSVLTDGSVLVATPEDDSGEARTALVRLDDEGALEWKASVAADRGDFLGTFGDLVVVGGREGHHLAGTEHPVPEGAALTALRAVDGQPAWTYAPAPGASVHVLGVHGDLLVALEHSRGRLDLFALDREGNHAWTAAPPATASQGTLRGGVVVLKSGDALLGHDAATGRRLWRFPIPPTFTPYGFTLAMMPSLDARHLLLPTTDDLRILDLATGRMRTFPMPTDGINTTFWPYQLLATDEVIGVVTNTGAVVVERG